MDRRRFDALSRILGGSRASRRATASGLTALFLSAALGAPAAGAEHRKKKCKPCHVRKRGKCVKAHNGRPCNGDGRCLAGTCNPKPECLSADANCDATAIPCCSGLSAILKGVCSCLSGAVDTPCLTESDCTTQRCVGFVCK